MGSFRGTGAEWLDAGRGRRCWWCGATGALCGTGEWPSHAAAEQFEAEGTALDGRGHL